MQLGNSSALPLSGAANRSSLEIFGLGDIIHRSVSQDMGTRAIKTVTAQSLINRGRSR